MITELSVNGIIEHYLSASTKPKNTDERIMEKIDANSWQSQYPRYKRTSF